MKYTATCETILQYMDGISSKFSALIIKIADNFVCRLKHTTDNHISLERKQVQVLKTWVGSCS